MVWGSIPFYESLTLGGASTVRGLSATRVHGEQRILLNTELRWRGILLSRNQHLYSGILIFADFGQIVEQMQGLSIENWRRGLGIGARILWQSTVVRADLARSDKRTGLYITFDQVF